MSLIFAATGAAASAAGIASVVSLLAGLVAAAVLFKPAQAVSGRAVDRILERPAG